MFFLVSTHNLITTNFKLHLLSTRIHACIYLGLTVATCDTLISRRPLERPKTDHHRSIISITPYVLRESKKNTNFTEINRSKTLRYFYPFFLVQS